MNNLKLPALTLLLALCACSEAPDPDHSGSGSEPSTKSGTESQDLATHQAPSPEEIAAAVEGYTRTFIEQQPALATTLGVPEERFGDYDRRLPDYSPSGMRQLQSDMREAAERLAGLQDPSLPRELQRHVRVNEVIARYYAGDESFPAGYIDTWGGHLPYVVNQISGPLIDLPNVMQDQHRVTDAEEAEDYLARLDAFARTTAQVREKMLADAEEGIILPRPLFPNTLGYLDNFMAPEAGEHPLVVSFAEKLENAQGVEAEQAGEYVARATEIVRDAIYPGIASVSEALQSLQDSAPESGGIWAQPGGESYYEHAITYLGDSSLDPERIHQLGRREVQRITRQMDEILSANGYDKGSVGARMQQLNEEDRFLYEDSDEGRAALLDFLRGEIATIEERAPDYFSTLPPQDVEVRRIPVAVEQGSAGGYYNGPSLDGSRPGVFFINLKDMNAVPSFAMKTLTYHEAVPGHHFQIALNMLQEDIGLMRRNAPFNGYVEGWALYSELLAHEMGMYEDDPFGNLGRLQAEVYRAARLVVDTGLHFKQWTREEAIDYFARATGTAMSDVVPAIDRYIAWPGQALGYKLGMVRLLALRERARAMLGEAFDIKDFHDVVLLPGARPLASVERDVEAWISEQRP